MKATRLARFVCAVGVVSACAFGLAACADNSNPSGLTGGTAATVNGVEIPEDTVTNYIQSFRASYGLDTEEAWGKWLASQSMTPETVREDVIDYYASQELIKQGAKENNAEVSSERVDEVISNMKAKYDSDEAWQQALTDAGTTEDAYRESVVLSLTESSLKDAVGTAEEATDEELLQYSAMYDGARRSSHILFNTDDEATAQEVLDKINSGELDFVEAVKEYSQDSGSATNDGDIGWDKLSSLVTEYTDGLKELEKGEVSGLVQSDYGWHIIKCTDVFEVPEGGLTSTDQVPSEILESVRSSLKTQKESTAFNEWFTTYKENADIVINDMPADVPYNIDMANYPAEDDSTDGTDNGSTDGSDNAGATDGSADSGDNAGSTDGGDANATDGSTEGGDDQAAGDNGEGSGEDGAGEADSQDGGSNSQQPAEAA